MTVDWRRYRRCPACHAPMGKACTSLTGAVVEGVGYVPDAVTIVRDEPHSTRQLRTFARREEADRG